MVVLVTLLSHLRRILLHVDILMIGTSSPELTMDKTTWNWPLELSGPAVEITIVVVKFEYLLCWHAVQSNCFLLSSFVLSRALYFLPCSTN